MIDQKYNTLLIVITVILVGLTVSIGSKTRQQLTAALSAPAPVNDTAATKRLSLINRAVQLSPTSLYFDYTADFENPFKLWNEQHPAKSQVSSPDSVPRVMLSLKGILIKDRPLAILDNGMGETQIRAAGEKAFDQLIIEISDNHVILRDHRGKYEIIVEEH
jgi:hypothetical protein